MIEHLTRIYEIALLGGKDSAAWQEVRELAFRALAEELRRTNAQGKNSKEAA